MFSLSSQTDTTHQHPSNLQSSENYINMGCLLIEVFVQKHWHFFFLLSSYAIQAPNGCPCYLISVPLLLSTQVEEGALSAASVDAN